MKYKDSYFLVLSVSAAMAGQAHASTQPYINFGDAIPSADSEVLLDYRTSAEAIVSSTAVQQFPLMAVDNTVYPAEPVTDTRTILGYTSQSEATVGNRDVQPLLAADNTVYPESAVQVDSSVSQPVTEVSIDSPVENTPPAQTGDVVANVLAQEDIDNSDAATSTLTPRAVTSVENLAASTAVEDSINQVVVKPVESIYVGDDAVQTLEPAPAYSHDSVDTTLMGAADILPNEQVATLQDDSQIVSDDAQLSADMLEDTSIAAAETIEISPDMPPENTETVEETDSMVVDADEALSQQVDDATAEKNLEEVFTSTKENYSLQEKGSYKLDYNFDYSYYRDSQIDLATASNSSTITRLRVQQDAVHNVTNSFGLQYGLLDNLTLTASLPFVAKTDLSIDKNTVNVGDVSLGMRYEPFALSQDRLPLIINAGVSLPTGKSPYEINPNNDLSTGRGYYSLSTGLSTRKYIDPVVLFGSLSANYGIPDEDLSQIRGADNRKLVKVFPGIGVGFATGFAYSLNYDVSLTMSYQQSFNLDAESTYEMYNNDGQRVRRVYSSADQTSASMNIGLGVRVSPTTLVNGSFGFGLTDEAPDVSLGLSLPLDFASFGKSK